MGIFDEILASTLDTNRLIEAPLTTYQTAKTALIEACQSGNEGLAAEDLADFPELLSWWYALTEVYLHTYNKITQAEMHALLVSMSNDIETIKGFLTNGLQIELVESVEDAISVRVIALKSVLDTQE